jgi:hypothetical protein
VSEVTVESLKLDRAFAIFAAIFRKDGIDQGLELWTRRRDASAMIPRVYLDEHADLLLGLELAVCRQCMMELGKRIGVVDDDVDAFRLQAVRETDESRHSALGHGYTVENLYTSIQIITHLPP